ncbi:MAG: hypothetical protein GEV04_21720 [Actinophytocola sp.]|nr:hypothetical protein [Actinophytocola sp.]
MASPGEREELRQLVDEMTDEQVSDVLTAARQVTCAHSPDEGGESDGLAWIGCITDGPEDLSVRAKHILRAEMGERRRRGPAA